MNRRLFAAALAFVIPAMTLLAKVEPERVEISGPYGKIAALITKPELQAGEKCPMVILAHGFTSRKEAPLLVQIGDRLCDAGIASIRFDFDGHGESDGAFVDMTVLKEVRDAIAVYDYVDELDYVDSISMLGHSQGGVVTAMAAGNLGAQELKCAVLMAPAAVLKDDAKRGFCQGTSYDPVNTPEYVPIMGGRVNLGRNYIKEAQTLQIYETAAVYTGPMCVIHGTKDDIVPYEYGQRFSEECQACDLYLLEGVDHGFRIRMQEAVNLAVGYLVSRLK